MTMTAMALNAHCIEPTTPANCSIIWLHGLGADGFDFAELPSLLSLPITIQPRIILPHAPVRPVTLNGGAPMRAWFDIKALTVNAAQDEAGIIDMNTAISELIDHEIEAGIKPKRIIIGGFSQGGSMALYSGLHYDERLGGLVGLSTTLVLAHQLEAEIHPANRHTPIFLAHGSQDCVIPIKFGELSYKKLTSLHYHVEWQSYPMAHTVCHAEWEDLSRWLAHILR